MAKKKQKTTPTARKKTAAPKTKRSSKAARPRATAGRQATQARGPKKSAAKSSRPRRSTTSGSSAQPARNIVVVIGDSDRHRIKQVAADLRARGMKIDPPLEAMGMITGTYSKPSSGLQRVKGVISVEETPSIQLPPPDSEVQ